VDKHVKFVVSFSCRYDFQDPSAKFLCGIGPVPRYVYCAECLFLPTNYFDFKYVSRLICLGYWYVYNELILCRICVGRDEFSYIFHGELLRREEGAYILHNVACQNLTLKWSSRSKCTYILNTNTKDT